jgi:hypothetical protein
VCFTSIRKEVQKRSYIEYKRLITRNVLETRTSSDLSNERVISDICSSYCFVNERGGGGGARVAQWVRSLDLTTHTSLSPIRRGFAPGFVNYKKGCTRLAATSDKVYQLLAHCRWFSPGTPASFTTKTGRHDIAEILLKVALKHQKSK